MITIKELEAIKAALGEKHMKPPKFDGFYTTAVEADFEGANVMLQAYENTHHACVIQIMDRFSKDNSDRCFKIPNNPFHLVDDNAPIKIYHVDNLLELRSAVAHGLCAHDHIVGVFVTDKFMKQDFATL